MKHIYAFCFVCTLALFSVSAHTDVPDPSQPEIDYIDSQMDNGGKVYYGGFNDNAMELGDPSDDTVILFVNGVLVNEHDFILGVESLKQIMPESLQDIPVYGFYNVSGTEHSSTIAKFMCPLAKNGISFFGSSAVSAACSTSSAVGGTADIVEATSQMIVEGIFLSNNLIATGAVQTLKETLRLTVAAGRRVIGDTLNKDNTSVCEVGDTDCIKKSIIISMENKSLRARMSQDAQKSVLANATTKEEYLKRYKQGWENAFNV
ncbi:hypothetical protein ACFLY0_00025 [Patescibacteria group bacterium]